MKTERERAFSKRGATLGLLTVAGATLALTLVAVAVAFLLRLAF